MIRLQRVYGVVSTRKKTILWMDGYHIKKMQGRSEMSHTTTAVLQEEVQDIIDVAKYKKQNAKAYI